MNVKLLKLNIRIIFSSVLFWGLILFSLSFYGLFVFVLAKQIDFSNYVMNNYMLPYFEVAIFILLFCEAAYFSYKDIRLEEICLIPKARALMTRELAVILSSCLILIIPLVGTIAMALAKNDSFIFWLLSYLYTLFRWIFIIAISQTVGFFLGNLVKNKYVFLLSIPFAIIFSFLNSYFFNFFNANHSEWLVLQHLLSLQNLPVTGMAVNYACPRIDLFLIIKELVVLSFCLIVCGLLYISIKRKFSILQVVYITCAVGLCGVSVFQYSLLYPSSYLPPEKLYSFQVENNVASKYEVISYTGNISLSEYSSFDCKVVIRNISKQADVLRLRLDSCLQLSQLTCNGKDVSYHRDGDYVVINDPDIVNASQIELDFCYSGRIYYITADTVNIFTSLYSSALPPYFAFLPLVDGDFAEKTFDLEVNTLNTLISNLDCTKSDKHVYSLCGSSDSVCLFVGFFEEYEEDGVTFYCPQFNNYTDYWHLNQLHQDISCLDYKTMELSKGIDRTYKKVFQLYFNYDTGLFPVSYEDYLIVHND